MENEIEIWKPVVGYEGYYEVSNIGNVRSSRFKNKIIRLRKNRGYYMVVLCVKNKPKGYGVHRLVAQAFLPNPNNLPECNHRDENPLNNRVDNLEWCTHEYNINYGTRTKRASIKKINGKCSKRVYQYTLDMVFIKEWPSLMEIKRQLGFYISHISACCLHDPKYTKAYGFIWRYADEVDKEKGAA